MEIEKLKDMKLAFATLCVWMGSMVGSIALNRGCIFVIYEPAKPKILEQSNDV